MTTLETECNSFILCSAQQTLKRKTREPINVTASEKHADFRLKSKLKINYIILSTLLVYWF